MAKLVLSNADVMVDSVDLGDHVKSLTIQVSKDIPDSTTMGDTWAEALCSTLHATGSIEFFQDYAALNVDKTVWTAFLTTAGVTIKFIPVAGANSSATNPIYYGTAHITEYTPLGGSHGDVCMAPLSFTFTGALTRDVIGTAW